MLSASVPAGVYFVEISSNAGYGSYYVDISGGAAKPASDVNSSFSQAGANSNLGVLGTTALTVSAQIQPQSILLPRLPGQPG